MKRVAAGDARRIITWLGRLESRPYVLDPA